jgi:hypothetical protein
VYRHVVLGALKRGYRQVAARRPVHTPVEQVERVRTIRQWDRLVVVPRHRFGTVENYYATQSVGPRLSELAIPALYVGATGDPMVPDWTVRPSLRSAGAKLQIHMLDAGGHVGFPARVVLTEPASSLDAQVTDWLDRVTCR